MPSLRQDSFACIAAALLARQSFVVLSHHHPDGDAYGSQLAVAHCLRALGKDVMVWNEDGMTEKYAFLPGSELVTSPAVGEGAPLHEFDCLVALDCSTFARLGRPLRALKSVGFQVNLDHHFTNEGYGDLVHIDDSAPATAQLLHEFFVAERLPYTPEMAANLFVGLSTDTGSFQYRGVNARTFEVAADLARRGADTAALSQACYDRQPLRRVKLLREMLNDLELTPDGRVATTSLSLERKAGLGLQPSDTEDLVNHLRSIDTVVVAGYLEEIRTGSGQPAVRMSLRSKSDAVDVSAVCAQFGGGGHRLAAGARPLGELAEVRRAVIAAVEAALP